MAVFTREDPTDRAAFDARYRAVHGDDSVTMRAVVHEGMLAGTIASFTIEGERELTYWIDPSRWGCGIATEALRQFLSIETQRPLYARVAEENHASRRVLEKGGFQRVGSRPARVIGRGTEVAELTLRLG